MIDYFFPKIDSEVQAEIDRDSINNMYVLSFLVIVIELTVLMAFVLTRNRFDVEAWFSIGSVLFCVIACFLLYVATGRMRRVGEGSHDAVTLLKASFFLIMSAWAIWVTWRHYEGDDQMLTFLAVQLILVCFLPFQPWAGVLLNLVIYSSLFIVLYTVDHAARINVFNYAVLVVVSIAGMSVRYHSQVKLAEKTVQLHRSNQDLEYLSRHDGLTGLRNRTALGEDVDSLVGRHLWAFMIDIDYFKEINDKYGHIAGDDVLKEAAERCREMYPDSFRYRYGGDEFLVICPNEDHYKKDTMRFSADSVPERDIMLSIGCAEDTPQDQDHVYSLISAADTSLYEVKSRTHSPEFGGHERRRSRK